MDCEGWLPPRDLEPFIDRFWRWRSGPGERIALPLLAPAVGAELFFHLGRPFQLRTEAAACSAVHLVAVRNQALDFLPQTDVDFLAVRFRAGMLRHFLPCEPVDVHNDWMPAEDLWGSSIRDLRLRLGDEPTTLRRLKALIDWLRGSLARYSAPDEMADAALSSIYDHPGACRMGAVYTRLGLGPRQFERRFKRATGLNPKHFQILARLYRSIRQEILDPGPRYVDRALDLGYFDQAHVIHDFQAYLGMSPARYLAEARARTHFYNPSRKRSS